MFYREQKKKKKKAACTKYFVICFSGAESIQPSPGKDYASKQGLFKNNL